MITEEEILAQGFTKIDDLSTDIVDSYAYVVKRLDKGRNVLNVYRLDRLIDTDYFELTSTLQRERDYKLRTFGYNGDILTDEDLFDWMELAREQNRKQ